MSDLFARLYDCLMCTDPAQKIQRVAVLQSDFLSGSCALGCELKRSDYAEPGRPERPELISPKKLPRRSLHTPEGHAALIHALAHIEFTAINLALDAAYRFRGMPEDFYADWLKIAAEEAYHYRLLSEHLEKKGYRYGDFPAHDGLWEMAQQTADDVLERMALVPRVLEARGLDATPGIRKRLAEAGDDDAAAILDIILRDEVGHVEIGTRWFHYCCDQRGLPRQETFEGLFQRYVRQAVKLPLHREARKSAGFTEQELDYLEGLAR